VEEDRERALEELRTADELARRQETPAPWWFRGLWVLLSAVDGDDDGRARQEVEAGGFAWATWQRGFLALADAVDLGRAGRKAEAEAALARGDDALAPARWCRHQGLRLVAEAAIEDGWGEPVGWLREALAFFEETGHHATVAACKRLLQEAGAAVPRRGRGNAVVPPGLRSLGITSREMDVLHLLVEGRSTSEMATKLFLSPRTVKTHIASLMQKSGTSSRQQLVAFAAEHGVEAQEPETIDVVDLADGALVGADRS
jgi:DNA-binding CsgD family transcriptional regulator